jgi:viroplasmin and RNaseH domain-containing protein
MPYYAVAIGRKPGVYNTWDECKVQVDKFVRSRYKKFDTYEQALLFIEEHSTNIPAIKTSKRKFSDETDSIVKKIKRIESEDVQKIIEVDSATDIVKIKDGM